VKTVVAAHGLLNLHRIHLRYGMPVKDERIHAKAAGCAVAVPLPASLAGLVSSGVRAVVASCSSALMCLTYLAPNIIV
jgi:hypothetical protein